MLASLYLGSCLSLHRYSSVGEHSLSLHPQKMRVEGKIKYFKLGSLSC